jgi:hypothetical protein
MSTRRLFLLREPPSCGLKYQRTCSKKVQKAHQAALIPRRSKRGAWLRKLPNGILLLWRGVEPAPFRLPKVQPELLPMPLSQLGIGSLGGVGASVRAGTCIYSPSGPGHSSAQSGSLHASTSTLAVSRPMSSSPHEPPPALYLLRRPRSMVRMLSSNWFPATIHNTHTHQN